MRVKAEIRDLSYKKKLVPMVLPLIIESFLMILIAALGLSNSDVIPEWITIAVLVLGAIIFLVLLVVALKKANNIYNTSWLMEEFDFVAVDGRLTLNGKMMHTNVHKSKRVIFVHDRGDSGNPYEATFSASVFGEDFEKLLEYIEENGVKNERENLPRGKGKYGWAAPLSVSKDRRR